MILEDHYTGVWACDNVTAMETGAIGNFNAELIESVALLESRSAALEQELARAREERDALAQKIEIQGQSILYYKERYELLQKRLFGKSSEKRILNAADAQLLPLFGDALRPTPPQPDKQDNDQAQPEKETITYDRRKRSRDMSIDRGSRFPQSLRRLQTVLEPEDKSCTSCGLEMAHVIRTEVTEKLCCSRDPFYVHEYHKPILGCRPCGEVAPAAEVPEVFERTSVDQSVVSYLLVNKFRYSIPLYRQGEMFRDIGLVFSNDALLDWASKGLDLLRPIYQELVRLAVGSRYLVTDDTRLRAAVGDIVKTLPGYKQGALWGLYALEHDVVAYVFTKGRTHAACKEVLKDFRGCLIVDGYDGFEPVGQKDGMTFAHCNNHARRGFVRAEGSDRKRAEEALLFYQELYRIEEEGREFSPEKRRELRQEKAVPVFNKFREWLVMVSRAAPPKSPLGKACAYVLKRWDTLRTYLDDGMIPIDTMAVERAFRVVALGRKNYLHAASELGAHGAAIGYALVNTCLLQDIDPFIYLCDVLERVGTCQQRDVATLLPQNWKHQYLEEATARYESPPAPAGAAPDPAVQAAIN